MPNNYVFGGTIAAGPTYTNLIHKYNTATETWSTPAVTLTTPKCDICGVECSDVANTKSLIAISDGYNGANVHETELFDTSNDTIAAKNNNPSGAGLRASAQEGPGNFGNYALQATGDVASKCQNAIYAFKSDANTWATVNTLPSWMRMASGIAFSDNWALLLAGFWSQSANQSGSASGTMYALNPYTATASALLSCNNSEYYRNSTQLVKYESGGPAYSEGITCGGRNGGTVKTVRRYSTSTGAWDNRTDMTNERYGAQMVKYVTSGLIAVAGGIVYAGAVWTRYKNTQKYTRGTDSWAAVVGGDLPNDLCQGCWGTDFLYDYPTEGVDISDYWIMAWNRALGKCQSYNVANLAGTDPTAGVQASLYKKKLSSKMSCYNEADEYYYVLCPGCGTGVWKTNDGVNFTELAWATVALGNDYGAAMDICENKLYIVIGTAGIIFYKLDLLLQTTATSILNPSGGYLSCCVSVAKDLFGGQTILVTYDENLFKYSLDGGSTWSSEKNANSEGESNFRTINQSWVHHYSHISGTIISCQASKSTGNKAIYISSWNPSTYQWSRLTSIVTNSSGVYADMTVDQNFGHIYVVKTQNYIPWKLQIYRFEYPTWSVTTWSPTDVSQEVYSGDGEPQVGIGWDHNQIVSFAITAFYRRNAPITPGDVVNGAFDPGATGTNTFNNPGAFRSYMPSMNFQSAQSAASVGDYGFLLFNNPWQIAAQGSPLVPLDIVTATSYGGRVYRPSIRLFDKKKQISCTVYGHAKTLESIPYWNVSEELGKLFSITGVELLSYTARPSGKTPYGAKKLTYKFPNEDPMKELTVRSVIMAGYGGLHWLHFDATKLQYAYHDGDWDTLTLDTVGQILVGSTVSDRIFVDLSKHPPNTASVLVNLVEVYDLRRGRNTYTIGDKGLATLQFDGGDEVEVRNFLNSCLFYDGANYTEITGDLIIEKADSSVTALAGADDYFYIGDTNLFNRIWFYIQDAITVGSLTIEYSFAFQQWKTLTLTEDTTTRLSGDGYWKFEIPEDWAPTQIDTAGGALVTSNRFWIRVRHMTSDTLKLYYLRKNILLRGVLGDTIEVTVDEKALPTESQEDTIIVRQRSVADKTSIVATYYQGITAKALAEKICEEAGFSSTHRDLSDITISTPNAAIADLGKPPLYHYAKDPTFIKYIDAIETLVMGVENELWKMEDAVGEWVKIGELQVQSGVCGFVDAQYDAGSGCLYAFAQYLKVPGHVHSLFTDYGRSRMAFVAKTDAARNVLDVAVPVYNSNLSRYTIIPGFWCSRPGRYWGTDKNGIGSNAFTSQEVGEQIAIAFPQAVAQRDTDSNAMHSSSALLAIAIGDDVFYFWDSEPAAGVNYGRVWPACPQGWYSSVDHKLGTGNQGDLLFQHSFGQSHFFAWDPVELAWLVSTYNHTETNNELQLLSGDSNSYLCDTWLDPKNNSWNWLACCYWKATRQYMISHIQWFEVAGSDGDVSYSYVSRIYMPKTGVTLYPGPYAWDKCWHYNDTGTTYTDATNNLNADTGTYTLDEVDDAIYIGNTDSKFFAAYFSITGSWSGTIAFEYWDGSAWTALGSADDGTVEDMTSHLTADGVVSWRIPRDWVTVAVNGSTAYWIRARVATHSSGSVDVTGVLQLAEVCVEYTDNNGYMVVNMTYDADHDITHGVLQKRNTLTWEYLTIDQNNPGTSTKHDVTIDGVTRDERCLRNLVHDAAAGRVYGILCDLKQNYYPALLIEINYSGGACTFTDKGPIHPTESDVNDMPSSASSGRGIFGVTRDGNVFNYSATIVPYIRYAELTPETNCRQALTIISQMVNAWWFIKDQKELIFSRRLINPTSTKKLGNVHIVSVEPMTRWKHFYDGVEVAYHEPGVGRVGQIQWGVFGYGRKILRITNPLVQYVWLAEHIAKYYGRFFTKIRRERTLKGIYLVQMELADGITLALPERYAENREARAWIVIGTDLDLQTKQMNLHLIENLEA